ncbi:MAG TPA: hypothetical protein VFH31_07435 [Pyrinomonadaceae bacterium]|nr:hypothetical protein [Pyrinomonadaceae bacterium]
MQVSSNGSGVNPPSHDRRAALVEEFIRVNAELRQLKARAQRLHSELIAMKAGSKKTIPSESQPFNAVDLAFNEAQQRLAALRQRNAEQASKAAPRSNLQTFRKVYNNRYHRSRFRGRQFPGPSKTLSLRAWRIREDIYRARRRN